MSDNGKKSGKKSGDQLVVQEHGGALKRGGTHPRPGRPPNELRGSMRKILEKGLPHLEEFATGEKDARSADQLKAIDIAAKFGLPKEPYDQDLINELWDATEGVLPDDPALIHKVKRAWVPVLASRLM